MAKVDIEGKSLEERMQMAGDIAMNYFRQGLNCTECVMRAFMDMHDTGLPEEVICMGTGFGGGIGHTKNICGAITGACMAVGMVKGRRDPFEKGNERPRQTASGEIYLFRRTGGRDQDKYGTLICRELSDPFGDFNGKERKRNCKQMIGYCASLAEKYAFQ